MIPFKLIAFVVLSALFAFISRRSFRAPRSHGLYRFFAWEFMLILFLLNVDVWFRDWHSWHQALSWLLLCGSVVPLGFGVHALAQGKPVRRRASEPQLFAFERTTALVTTGIYRYIRHPLYSSLLLLAWGIFFKDPSWLGIVLAVAVTLFLRATASADESECVRFFGQEYASYAQRTKRFVPFLY